MTASQRLESLVQHLDEQIFHIASRPLMYVGGEPHLHTAEVMVRLLLHAQDEALGCPPVDRALEREYLFTEYPGVPGPVRSVATGSKFKNLDFSEELLKYIAWHKSLRSGILLIRSSLGEGDLGTVPTST